MRRVNFKVCCLYTENYVEEKIAVKPKNYDKEITKLKISTDVTGIYKKFMKVKITIVCF